MLSLGNPGEERSFLDHGRASGGGHYHVAIPRQLTSRLRSDRVSDGGSLGHRGQFVTRKTCCSTRLASFFADSRINERAERQQTVADLDHTTMKTNVPVSY